RKFVVAKKKNKRSESRKEDEKEGFFKAEGNCSDGGCEVDVEEEDPVPISEGKEGSSTVKRRREFLEEARKSVLECGKVMHLVKAFEQLLTVPKSSKEGCGEEEEEEEEKKVIQWALPAKGENEGGGIREEGS
ncbi:Microtubule-destabilizing protein 60, partial [Linum perenne]